ncbi:AMP-binding protein [Antrihabitans sp. YC2-6]|uniref:AMP-binding protein n=1 Tax=Antrihabitans sp. YC2-6 TaxID=2799498 RepID=UPI0018F77655|nr:AMP-binding protein [Antrihabitans sp. YC2-6]MBJ8348250.1 AMP-binding protein [Antrihabitans sp. YC2-6]
MSTTFVSHLTDKPEDGLVLYDPNTVETYRGNGLWNGRALAAELLDAAEKAAANPAITTADESLTYRDLVDRAKDFARGTIATTDLRSGDVVMFQMGNVIETVVSYLGFLFAGVKPVCTLPQHGTREIRVLAEHTGSRTLIVQCDFAGGRLREQARSLSADGPIDTVIAVRGSIEGAVDYADVLAAGRAANDLDLPGLSVNPLGIAVFQLSGGTTGLPKVAPRLHEEYAYNARIWADAMAYRQSNTVVYALPLMHNAGISLAVQPAILAGAHLVLLPDAGIDGLLDAIETYPLITIPLVPPALAVRLLETPRATETDFGSVANFVVGGQRLPVEVAEQLRDKLGINVRQMFGMAEGLFTLTPADADEYVRYQTVGSPISPHDDVRILMPGSEDEVVDGEVGEFCARGPYTIRGYYRADAHNAAAFTSDGFYRTGDLSRRHVRDGRIFYSIEGRIKDVINRGVEKIHAEEVEEVIVRHPDIVNVAVVAMSDRVLGEKACAYLVLEPGAADMTVEVLAQYLLDHGLAKYKFPERVEVVAEFPLTNVGKVSKKLLREDVERRLHDEEADR